MIKRKPTKEIKVGKVRIGNKRPIIVQSMATTLTKDIDATIKQIHSLEKIGCEIVRVAVPDMESVKALKTIKKNISIPLVADIHFDYRLAIESAKYVDKLRLNPGNIDNEEHIKAIVYEARQYSIPIRIGVNLGSLEKDIESKYGRTTNAMVESALSYIRILENQDFTDIIVSLKTSDVFRTISSYRLFSEKSRYPIHLGLTEAGTAHSGTITSAIGIGRLLLEGIGDTIRVSLSEKPEEEIKVGWRILKALKLREKNIRIKACPTCARACLDVASIAKKLETKTFQLDKSLNIAIMGCSVNGPGEAKEADLGIFGGKQHCLLNKKGKIIEKLHENEAVMRLLKEIDDN